jgi:hypothetical protein
MSENRFISKRRARSKHRQEECGPEVPHELRLRERLQCSRPRARQRLVKQAARRRCEIVLGSARLLVLGGVIFC